MSATVPPSPRITARSGIWPIKPKAMHMRTNTMCRAAKRTSLVKL